MKLPMPSWLDDVPKKDRANARMRFLLKLAALYASESGSLGSLSSRMGYSHRQSLSVIISHRGNVSPEQAVRIEEIVSREVVTREALRPDIFLPA